MIYSPHTLDQLRRQASDPVRRVLITGATVVTMEPSAGPPAVADVLLVGDVIAAVGPDLASQGASVDAVVIDASGCIVAPGFVDTHRHAWQGQIRRLMPDVDDLGAYLMATLAQIAPRYRPHDMYVGTKLSALTAIDNGITCLLDFSHNSRSPEHSDMAIAALRDTGIRGVHASMAPHFGAWDEQWPGDLERLRSEHFSSGDGLLTLRLAALATDEIAGDRLAYGPQLAQVARDLDIGVSVDAVFGQTSSAAISAWAEQDLLGPDVTLIHSTGLSPQAWATIGDTGTTIALAPTSEPQIGLETAVPAIDEALAVGVRPGLSIDVEVALASDMFTQMRTLLAIQRMRAIETRYGTALTGPRISTSDVLDLATLQGAVTNGLGAVTGSLAVGKQADLMIVGAEELNTMPLNDAVGTLVLGSDARNIQAVFIGGSVRKWAGRVLDVDLDALRSDVAASRDHVVTEGTAAPAA